MWWPWRHRRDPDAADKAIAESRELREAAEQQRAEVSNVVSKLRRLREANHFADSIRDALGEGR